ncbi:amino acid ABC transporter [Mesorhizobium sp. Root554]|uniref:ABC transporter substrate-binding protein n=1 Tax=unclassified Mesorhizobium TaxID=325217 RepID=UPI00070045A1|nr:MULTISPECIES: ABC transporter substrate-binding protein [unclassified Mesorhizobium]KQZ15587.1 amino acid ABC transporter [Mesorhizobium sp. Root1471]KQZ38095.1 amino acid ABC transporter [Mesorhizobium sp. Root554]
MKISGLLASLLGLAMVAATCLPANAQSKLRIATEGAYPPFNSVTADGKIVGFDVDIANALCARLKVECEIVAQDWDGLIPGLQAGKFDMIVASMTITDERKKQIAFTHKYYATPFSLVAPKASDLSGTVAAAFKGKALGAQASTVLGDYAQKVYGKAGADVKLYPSQEEAMADLMNGRLDAVLSDKFFLMSWLNGVDGACCRMLGDIEGTAAEAGIGVRLDNTELRDSLNAALDAIIADGTYRKIQAKYFDFDIY